MPTVALPVKITDPMAVNPMPRWYESKKAYCGPTAD